MDIQLSGELDESIDALLEPRQAQLLLIIARSDYPLGARELIRRLDGPDKRLSESTVNRLLRQLDQQGLTESLDGRGRVLSKTGRAVAARSRERSGGDGSWSLDIRSLSDVQDLLRARRGIEREVARSVALTATKADIARLRQSIAAYGESIDSERRRLITVDFHKALTEMSDNPILRSAATVLFDTRFDVFEQILDAMTAGRGRTHQPPRARRSGQRHRAARSRRRRGRDGRAPESAVGRRVGRGLGRDPADYRAAASGARHHAGHSFGERLVR